MLICKMLFSDWRYLIKRERIIAVRVCNVIIPLQVIIMKLQFISNCCCNYRKLYVICSFILSADFNLEFVNELSHCNILNKFINYVIMHQAAYSVHCWHSTYRLRTLNFVFFHAHWFFS